MRSGEEITAEIAALKELKSRVRERSAFGDNHRDAIHVQIAALEERMDEGEVWDCHEAAAEDEPWHAENERDAGFDAVRWMNGESDYERPSAGWKELVV